VTTITEKNIKGGFKGARLIPFNLESIILKLNIQLQTPMLAEEEASQA
jgi:hypothetical protein